MSCYCRDIPGVTLFSAEDVVSAYIYCLPVIPYLAAQPISLLSSGYTRNSRKAPGNKCNGVGVGEYQELDVI